MNNLPLPSKTQYIAAFGLLTVAIIDILIPNEFVIDILYLCCTLLVFRQTKVIIITFSIAACLLIMGNAFFEHILQFSFAAWSNRVISIFAIIATTYIAIQYRKLNELSKLKERHYLKALEEMLFIASHKVRKPVTNILGLARLIESEDDLDEEKIKEYCVHFIASATELDSFTKELTLFIKAVGLNQGKI